MDTDEGGQGFSAGRVFGGLVIILVGAAMLFDRTGLADIRLSSHLWPLILIALGLVRMAEPPRKGRRARNGRGTWLLLLGAWGLVNEFHLFGFDYDSSWPLLIIAAGVAIVWCALAGPHETRSLERS